MASIFTLPWADVGSGITPSAGAQLFFFQTGTAIDKPVYKDQAATDPYTQPVTADALGVFPVIWIEGDYKVQLKDENDVQIREQDPVGEATGGGSIPTGTRMLFQQTTVPVGWTKDLSLNNRALRLTNGTVSNGGSVDFSTAFASQPVTGSISNTVATGSITVNNHTLTANQSGLVSHRHISGAPEYDAWYGLATPGGNRDRPSGQVAQNTSPFTDFVGGTSAGQAHNHTGSFSGVAHNHTFTGNPIDLGVLFTDVVIGVRD